MSDPRVRVQQLIERDREERIREIAESMMSLASFQRGRLRFYPISQMITYVPDDGKEFRVPLAPKPFNAALYLAKRPGVIFSRYHLAYLIAIHDESSDRAIDSVIKVFRRAVGKASGNTCNPIVTVYGAGYRWVTELD